MQNGRQITFTIDKPGQYFVKINGSLRNGNTSNSRFIYLPICRKQIYHKPDDPDVIYFAPGIYPHQNYKLQSGKTYYLAPGAFVNRRFFWQRYS